MAVPDDIKAVKRPKNTVVKPYGVCKDKYSVVQRIGCKNKGNGRRWPVDGPTIGHIIDHVYVALDGSTPYAETGKSDPARTTRVPETPNASVCGVDLKNWANISLCQKLFAELYSELLTFYSAKDAQKIACIVILRVCNKGICDYELGQAYKESFLTELMPGVALSKNTVSKFLGDLGRACSKIFLFMRARTGRIDVNRPVLIDGTLKSNDSKVNSLSDFSRKAKTKGSRDISVLYAFDLEKDEPICSQCFPGNMLDLTAYGHFIETNQIKSGIIVADKGFPASAIKKQLAAYPGLHYLNPIKRNSKAISELDLAEYDCILKKYPGIQGKKAATADKSKFYYSFRDIEQAHLEERSFLEAALKKDDYDDQKFKTMQATRFGTIVLESDIDMTLEDAYKAYSQRWEIELVMRFYKQACGFDETRVHDDYSVIGSEFCNFLASVLTYRLIHAFDRAGLLEKWTYKQVMKTLERAKKVRVDGKNWQLVGQLKSYYGILEKLGLMDQNDMNDAVDYSATDQEVESV